jgi:acyl-CoA thioester hydrolase
VERALKQQFTAETRLRVRYAETDQMGVVYHANYVVWFEVGRVELLRSLGFSYRDMERNEDCHIAVVDVRCRYKAPAMYDDEIVVRTQLKNVRESLLHFGYEVLRADDGSLLAEGETTHIVVNSKFEKTVLPQKYARVLTKALEDSLQKTPITVGSGSTRANR